MKRNNDAAWAIMRRGAMASALLFTLVLALGLQQRQAAARDNPAETYVTTMAVKAINVLSDRSLSAPNRHQRFEELILSSFDAPQIARYVLGSRWDDATDDQKARFLKVYERALVKTYTDKFFDYDGHSLHVIGSQPDGAGALVKTTVATPTGTDTYKVNWLVTQSNQKQQFFDVVIDGVSTNRTTRQDYAAVLRSNGGDLNQLIALLEAKTP